LLIIFVAEYGFKRRGIACAPDPYAVI
jgi:hypothetical protein